MNNEKMEVQQSFDFAPTKVVFGVKLNGNLHRISDVAYILSEELDKENIEEKFNFIKKVEDSSLRREQWSVIENLRNKMDENHDKRYIFLIREGSYFYNGKKGYEYKAGYLLQDVLAIKSQNSEKKTVRNSLDLIPFKDGGNIKYSFNSKKKGEDVRRSVKPFRIRRKGTNIIDITGLGIKNFDAFNTVLNYNSGLK